MPNILYEIIHAHTQSHKWGEHKEKGKGLGKGFLSTRDVISTDGDTLNSLFFWGIDFRVWGMDSTYRWSLARRRCWGETVSPWWVVLLGWCAFWCQCGGESCIWSAWGDLLLGAGNFPFSLLFPVATLFFIGPTSTSLREQKISLLHPRPCLLVEIGVPTTRTVEKKTGGSGNHDDFPISYGLDP